MGTKCWMSDASHLILCQQPSAVYFSDVLCAVFLFDVGVGGGGAGSAFMTGSAPRVYD